MRSYNDVLNVRNRRMMAACWFNNQMTVPRFPRFPLGFPQEECNGCRTICVVPRRCRRARPSRGHDISCPYVGRFTCSNTYSPPSTSTRISSPSLNSPDNSLLERKWESRNLGNLGPRFPTDFPDFPDFPSRKSGIPSPSESSSLMPISFPG